jgi:hypothetical protein
LEDRLSNTLEVDGRTCRDLFIQHSTGNFRGSGGYRFCEMQDGQWKTTGRTPDE